MRSPTLIVVALLAAGCPGPRQPGAQPNVVYFWRLTSSAVEFNASCSDNAKFRADNPAYPVSKAEDTNKNGKLDPGEDLDMDGVLDGATYVMYKASEDAKKATLQRCEFLSPSSCSPAPEEVVFDVAGGELTFTAQRKRGITPGMCNLLDTQSWLFTDKGQTLEAVISHTLSLVDDPVVCPQVEASQKASSPNGMGFEGCNLSFTFSAELDPY